MYSISSNGIIVMNAGDTLKLHLFINKGTNLDKVRYKLKRKDIVYLSICEPNQDFNHGVIRKIFTKKNLDKHGDVLIELNPSDTENIEDGTYFYEIKIKLGNGNIDTIVPKRKFFITD